MDNLRSQYFNWLFSISNLPAYSLLFKKLFSTEFWWAIPFDDNRADDGIQLRYKFGRLFDIPDPIICSEIDICGCSLLELIVALAIRCEEDILRDENIGDRTSLWISNMIDSLGLLYYHDVNYNEKEVNAIIDTFLNRGYSRTGKGGLFQIPNLDPSRDMRKVEIWCQMNWYINENMRGKENGYY